jgi:hypothetical protein
MHAQNTAARKPRNSDPIIVSDADRATVQHVARALEHALDTLPEESPWRTQIARFHGDVAIGLEPRDWLDDEQLERLGLEARACPAPGPARSPDPAASGQPATAPLPAPAQTSAGRR